MLKLIPSKVECYDMVDGKFVDDIFTVEAFDEGTCHVKITTCVGNWNIEEVLSSIRDAVKMLELE